MIKEATIKATCYHCGDTCNNLPDAIHHKVFCCSGCKNVYLLLNRNHLDYYYCLNETPGQKMMEPGDSKFGYLDDPQLSAPLIRFHNDQQTSVCFYLPQIHCSSCLWLLEHLQKMNNAILSSQVNFTTKEVAIAFNHNEISLRSLVELLAAIGYEPLIDLNAGEKNDDGHYSSKKAAYKLGVTGFCFANIMLISFPEYLGMHATADVKLALFFRVTNLFLALPVLFWGASEFFRNAWYSFRQKYINIDAPIALAITVTFSRSVYEIITQTGAGYMDSMSGIVFFMLLGRTLQNRAYTTLQFNRNYKSYFPVAVHIKRQEEEKICALQDLQEDDVLFLRHGEIVPTDGILTQGKAQLDYSFVTGESKVEHAAIGEIIYAGARVTGAAIEVICVKPFSQNSFTRLWNNKAFSKEKENKKNLVGLISRHFSFAVFTIAVTAFIYWLPQHPHKAWNALTAVLIVACPCALLLTSTFTNGYLIDYLSRKGFFIKNADVIERLSRINSVTFDKTGTLTTAGAYNVKAKKMELSDTEQAVVCASLSQTLHPLSLALAQHLRCPKLPQLDSFREYTGQGIEATYNGDIYRIGSSIFTGQATTEDRNGSEVFVTINGTGKAHFLLKNSITEGVQELIPELSGLSISLLSGDNAGDRPEMEQLLGPSAALLFQQSPEQKLAYIDKLQRQGQRVMMIGDGLNDAGALRQSDVGVAIIQNALSFSPASDVIMTADRMRYLAHYIQIARSAQNIILGGFIYSLLFNLIGIYFAVSAQLSPMIAAILMPSSSLGIILIAYAGIGYTCRKRLQ